MRVLVVAFACLACKLHAWRRQRVRAPSLPRGEYVPSGILGRIGTDPLIDPARKLHVRTNRQKLLAALLATRGGASNFRDDTLGALAARDNGHWSATSFDPSLPGHEPWIPPKTYQPVPARAPRPVPVRVRDNKTKSEELSKDLQKPETKHPKRTLSKDLQKPGKLMQRKRSKKLKAFAPGRPKIDMNDEAKQKLTKGQIWQSTKLDGKFINSNAVMDIDASPSVIWSQLLDFDSYPSKIPTISKAQVYKRQYDGGIEKYWVQFVSSPLPGIALTYNVKYTYEPQKHSITWELDQSWKNDIEDVQGHWHVEQNPEDSLKSRVYFESGLVISQETKGAIPHSARVITALAPHWLKDNVVNAVGSTLISARTSWVKSASERATAHGAQKLRPLQKSRPFTVDQSIEDVLKKNKTWKVVTVVDNIAIGQAVMDIEATPGVTWDQLLNFTAYPGKAPKVHSSTEVYKRESKKSSWLGGTVERSFVKFVSRLTPGVKVTNHLDFSYDKSKNSATFKLDTEQSNDFEELQGHWHVERHPKDPNKARVFYEVGIVAPKWLPGWLLDRLVHRAIELQTAWVKRESELIGSQDVDDSGEVFEQLSPYLISAAVQVVGGLIFRMR